MDDSLGAPAAQRRRRRWPWVVLVVVLAAAAGGAYVWYDQRQIHRISVSTAVDRFRSETPAATASALPVGPADGVYVYATVGSERISVGKITHRYPAKTSLTVRRGGCGLIVRWDALAERWMQWELCPTSDGWRLATITDLHKFLYLTDKQQLDCGDSAVLKNGADFTCSSATTHTNWRFTVVGHENRTVAGKSVPTTHVHGVSHTSGASINDETVEVWLADGTGLPVHIDVRNHGAQHVLGQDVTYDEAARFDLTSLEPSR